MGSRVDLRDSLAQDIRHVAGLVRLAQLLFAGRIYPLADNDGIVKRNFDGADAGRDDNAFFGGGTRRNYFIRERRFNGGYMLARSAAAPADDPRSGADELNDVRGEIVRRDEKAGLSVNKLGKSRVRLYENREICRGGEALDVREHQIRPKPAVEPDSVNAQAFKNRRDSFDIGSRQKFTVTAESDSRENGKRRVFLRGEDGGLKFVCVAHRFNRDQICAGGRSEGHQFRKCVVRAVKFKVARRF